MSNPSWREMLADPWYLIAFGFGSGLSPRAPGTVGSLFALAVFLPLITLPIIVQIGIILVAFAVGVPITDRVARRIAQKDPAGIVWDEFVGMWITLLWLPSAWWLGVAFLLFRFFDIVKPWPVNLADRSLGGGLGIMLDDVIAGLYALASLQLCAWCWFKLMNG